MPANARSSKSGRYYVWESERFWSVTTIIDNGVPKSALKWWAARTVAEFAYDDMSNWIGMTRPRAVDYLKREPFRYTSERADFGSAVHDAAEALAVGKPIPRFASIEERQAVAAFLDWTRKMRPRWVLAEASVYHRTQRYAGTLDAVWEVPVTVLDELRADGWEVPWQPRPGRDTVTLLGDYKTGGDVAEEKGVYGEVALQLAAYSKAEWVGLPNGQEAPLPELDGAACLHIGPAGWRLVPVRIGDDVWRAFLYAREVFRWMEKTSRTVLGTPYVHIYDPAAGPGGNRPTQEANTP